MTDYQKQAIDFLTESATTFKAEFIKFDFYFEDDKQKRNIFKITLQNSRHKFAFNFGSSLKDSLKNSDQVIYDPDFDFYFGLKYAGLKHEYLSYSAKIKISDLKNSGTFSQCAKLIDKNKTKEIYDDFIKDNSGKYHKVNIIPFSEWYEKIVQSLVQKTTALSLKNWGEGIPADSILPPTEYDVLACLEKYPVNDFEDFCSNYGYDTDSRKAYKTYKAVKREWENVNILFNDAEIEKLREIQ